MALLVVSAIQDTVDATARLTPLHEAIAQAEINSRTGNHSGGGVTSPCREKSMLTGAEIRDGRTTANHGGGFAGIRSNTRIFHNPNERATVYTRVEAFSSANRLVGFPWHTLREGCYGGSIVNDGKTVNGRIKHKSCSNRRVAPATVLPIMSERLCSGICQLEAASKVMV